MLEWFSTDPLKKAFKKSRRGSGGTYFMTTQAAIEKGNIHHAKLSLQLGKICPKTAVPMMMAVGVICALVC